MKIRELLLPELQRRFPDRELKLGLPPDPIAIFPAIHPEIGDVEIWDDDIEATIGIKDVTHGHFNPYDSSLSPDELAEQVTSDVLDFLTALFSDRVLFWVANDASRGGWQLLEYDQPQFHPNSKHFLWSGPVSSLPQEAP